MNCNMIQDLLPNYVQACTTKETNEEIEKHLQECEECRKIYENLLINIPQPLPEGENVDKKILFFKKIRKRYFVLTAFLILFGGFYLFAGNYEIPLPFDENRMFVEPFQAAVVSYMDGKTKWYDMTSSQIKNIPENPEKILDLVKISYSGINHLRGNSRGRNMKRNDEDVWVVYYSYCKSLWDSLFYDADLSEESESGSVYGTNIYGDAFQSKNYKPQMREIYYLPMTNIHEIENLSDEEFEALKENATLVWKGIV